VLVVHADPLFAERIVRALSGHGIRAESVADGELAIDRFVQSPACALVVDSELPGRDGAATIESIRWAPGGALVPVVLTAERAGGLKLSETGKRLGAATLEGAAARDPEAVAQLVRRVLGNADRSAPTRDALTSPAIAVSHTSPTLSALQNDAHGLADDESLPPVSSAGLLARPKRERETVAARTRMPAFGALGDPDGGLDSSVDEKSAPFVRGDDPDAEQEGRDVERRAADLTPGAATHSGRFAQLPFPRVLARLASQRATGALVVVAKDDERLRTTTGESPKKVVYFRNGVPVYVKSNLVRECLGQILVQSDAITPEQRNESVRRMRAGEGRQGAILVALGALTPDELRAALEEQLRVKLYDLFSWDEADFRFSSRVLPPPEVVTLELGLTEIVFEGVVRRIPPARLLALLEPHLASYVVPVSDRMTRFVRLDLVVEARNVLGVMDGTQRLRDLLAVAGTRPGAAAQLVYAMECLGALRFSDLAMPTERPSDDESALDDDDATPREPIPTFRAPSADAVPRFGKKIPERAYDTGWDDETNDESSVAALSRWDEMGARIPAPNVARPSAEENVAPPSAPAQSSLPQSIVPQSTVPQSTVPQSIAPQSTVPQSTVPQSTVPQLEELAEAAAAARLARAALDARVERIAEAERHFRRGERAFARGKHDDALAAFTRAVELAPEESTFQQRLAEARARSDSS